MIKTDSLERQAIFKPSMDRAQCNYILHTKQSRAWHHLQDPEVNEVFFGGGAGSGKSELICVWEQISAMTYPETVGLIARNEFTDLQKSTIQTFRRIAKKLGYVEKRDWTYNNQTHIVTWINGSMTFFMQLYAYPSDPEFQSLGSVEFTRVSIDEAPEITIKAKDIVSSRIRYNLDKYGLTPKLLMTGNPGDHWIRENYVLTKDDQPVILKDYQRVVLATLLDNPNKSFVKTYKQQLSRMTNDYDIRRLLHGDWMAKPKSGMEYFHMFTTQHNVRKNTFRPDLPLHVTYDFNVNPYITLLVCQIISTPMGYEVNFLKEYCAQHPFNTTECVSQMLVRDIESGFFKGAREIYYYGDASGKNQRTTASQDIKNDFDMIRKVLTRYLNNYSNRVLTANPPHAKAREFMNQVFAGRFPISLTIDEQMYQTKKDLQNLKQGADGLMLKEYDKDTITKARYEKYGHCSQALYYLVISAFREHFKRLASAA